MSTISKPMHEKTTRRLADIAFVLASIDHELHAISASLRSLQPRETGMIALSFYPCGAHCLGCPHPRWLQWAQGRSISSKRPTFLASHRVSRPAMRVRTTGEFAPGATKVRKLITRAVRLCQAREKLIRYLSDAKRVAGEVEGLL